MTDDETADDTEGAEGRPDATDGESGVDGADSTEGTGNADGTDGASAPTVDGESVGPMDWWDQLEEDARATAAEYEERGWESLQLHTADVTPLDREYGDHVGLSVLVPDDEFEELSGRLSPGDVESEVYRTNVLGYVALLVVLEDHSRELAVVFPAYYAEDDDSATRLFEGARERGELDVFLRNLARERITVTLSDPDLLALSEDAA